MNYGLYLSASGVLTNLYRQDVYANNLANAQTVGFKPDVASITQRDPEAIEDDLGLDVRQRMLDQLGGGALAGPQRIAFTPGPLQKTGNPTDVALEGRDEFFVIAATDPNTGQVSPMLTRDGRFSRGSEGYLVATATGHHVLDTNDSPIPLDEGPVQIDTAGHVRQGGEVVAQIQVTRVADPSLLQKAGHNAFRFTGTDNQREIVDNPQVRPEALESSAVDPIQTLMKLIEATKEVSSNGNLIRYHDLLMDRAVNILGRVVA